MNTNGNTYTVIYSTVLVVLVAAILAFVAMILQDKQNENVKLETISKLLTAAAQSDENFTIAEDADVLGLYAEHIQEAFFVDGYGQKVKEMNTGKSNVRDIQVTTTSDLKSQNDKMKKIEAGDTTMLAKLELPVYIFDIHGALITVLPCYGAGLWGPIWGYIAVASDGKTIEGAVFDHKGETPGLGAKITEDYFCEEFLGKTINMDGDVTFAVAKATAISEAQRSYSVDAISGATITSQALGNSINLWAKYYKPYLVGIAAAAAVSTENSEMVEEIPAEGEFAESNTNVEE